MNRENNRLATKQDIQEALAVAIGHSDTNFNWLATKIMDTFEKTDKRIDGLDKKLDIMNSHSQRRLDLLDDRTITLKSTLEGNLKTKISW